jgi:hypothetical protein
MVIELERRMFVFSKRYLQVITGRTGTTMENL